MKPALTLHLLGPMRLSANGQDLEVPSRKARCLLAYLALRQDIAVPRETLCGLLWGDRGEEQARASLRQTLSALRRALGDQASFALAATHDSVTLHSNAISTDVGQLERAAKSEEIEDLEAAAGLYGGDLLEGLSLDEPAFEQWVSGERERCRATAQKVLSRLVELLQIERRIEDAILAASRLLSLDPLQENVHRTLMRLYVEQGRYDAALNQFEQCRKRLSETLGVQPEQETRDLAADVRSKRRQPAAEVQSSPTTSDIDQIEALPGQNDGLTYPERPSIAVLPFTNMSGDPEQEYFADGITEDIITELGRFREIFVIARNSSFAFKGKFVDAPEVGKMLGARYLLEGSVRRAGSRIRISAEMIEASTRAQIWADRYDRDLSDVFALQDEISRTIVVTMAGRLTEEHANRVSRKPTENLSAYDCVLRGQGYVHKYTSEAFDQARIYFEQAVSLDPEFARAFSWLAYIEAQGCLYWQMSTEGLDGAIQTGERAIALDQNDATGHMALGLEGLGCDLT